MSIDIIKAENNADLLVAMTGDEPVTVRTAMQIPMICRCINMIAGAAAMLPIRLYRRTKDGVCEIEDDRRLDILNRDTGDTMCADYMRYAWVRDLLLTGAGYAYIERRYGKPHCLYYVSSEEVSRDVNRMDPLKKVYRYNIGGRTVEPWEMLKILRNTDGYGGGRGILAENPEIIGAAYGLIKYQKNQIKTGGAKRGMLRTNGLKQDVIDKLKAKWAAMWGSKDDRDTMFIINAQDADFKEMSSTSVDMQLNQTQETMDKELMKLFGTNDGLLTEETVKNAVLPVLDMIEAALDQDMLMESEKKDHYFAFDTRELLRGDINQRYQAYATGLSQNFIQLDEVRKMEDLPPLGINFIKLGLNDVLLDPKTGTIYTPNTNQYAAMGKSSQIPLTDEENESIIENEIRKWVTIGGRHVLLGKDDGSGGGSSANKAYDNAEERRSLFSEKLASGKISAKINPEKQARHKMGDPRYIDGRSYVTATDEQLQEFSDKCTKSGDVHIRNNGTQFTVTNTADYQIGVDIDDVTNKKTPTNRATTHYSKTGAHVVPSKPESGDKND